MKRYLPLILTSLLLVSCTSNIENEKEVIDILMIGSSSSQVIERINSAINEIIKDEDYKINIMLANNPSYDYKLNSLMLSDDLPDLFVVKNRSKLVSLAEEDKIAKLDSYLENSKFATDILTKAEWLLTDIKGDTFAVPFNNKSEHRFAFAMNGKICDELEIDETKITNLEELHDVLLKVKEVYKDIPVVTSNYSSFGSLFLWDSLEEDSSNHGMASLSLDGSGEVKLITELDEFKYFASTMRRWNAEGLIISEPSFNNESRLELVNSKKAFGGFCSYSYLLSSPDNIFKENNTRYAFIGGWRLDNLDSNNTFALSKNCDKKDKALKALEQIYFNKDITKILLYGVEGVDYYKDEEGKLRQINNSSRYGTSAWCIPNNRTVLRDVEEKNDVYISPSYGFWFDYSSLKRENALCKSVMDKYYDAIISGQIDTDYGILRCHNDLINAGASKIIEEEQRQLNQFLSK